MALHRDTTQADDWYNLKMDGGRVLTAHLMVFENIMSEEVTKIFEELVFSMVLAVPAYLVLHFILGFLYPCVNDKSCYFVRQSAAVFFGLSSVFIAAQIFFHKRNLLLQYGALIGVAILIGVVLHIVFKYLFPCIDNEKCKLVRTALSLYLAFSISFLSLKFFLAK